MDNSFSHRHSDSKAGDPAQNYSRLFQKYMKLFLFSATKGRDGNSRIECPICSSF